MTVRGIARQGHRRGSFWGNVRVVNGCWEWRASLKPNGYGQLRRGGRTMYAHRFAWTSVNRLIPEGLEICHSCDNRRCVKPGHMFLGTRLDNVEDAMAKGRNTQKIPASQISKIRMRRQRGEKLSVLAKDFGVDRTTISWAIKNRAS